jgi:hypothetical protein
MSSYFSQVLQPKTWMSPASPPTLYTCPPYNINDVAPFRILQAADDPNPQPPCSEIPTRILLVALPYVPTNSKAPRYM